MIAAAPRLISKIQQRENGCWELDVVVSKNGYVSLGYRDEQGAARRVYAHRLSYILHVGAIPDGMDLDHLCRNRRCCNHQSATLLSSSGEYSLWIVTRYCPGGTLIVACSS